jgi:hypothetical protein
VVAATVNVGGKGNTTHYLREAARAEISATASLFLTLVFGKGGDFLFLVDGLERNRDKTGNGLLAAKKQK